MNSRTMKRTFISLIAMVFILAGLYAVQYAMSNSIVTPEAIGVAMAAAVIWLYQKWRKSMRIEQPFVPIQFIED